MSVKFPINISKKKGKKIRSKPNITRDSVGLLESTDLTKRLCLGVTNTFVDFLGLACPFVLRFKLLMKELSQGDLNWDQVIPYDQKLV